MTEKKPLLIITRPQKQSEQLLDALTKRLRRVPRSIINPLINIKDLKVDLPKSLMNPFIFTSQNAVSILAQRTSQRGDVYCVGLKVADLAKANGFNVISTSETVEKMINTGLPKKCSYFRGKQITVDIASQPSIKMDEYILYAQELPVYSENMANHLVNCLNSNNDHIIVVCISNKVSKPFEKLGFKNIIVSPEPSSDAMIETLATKV